MSTIRDIADLITREFAVVGYPRSGQPLPYIVVRPMDFGDSETSLAGSSYGWDSRFAVYCCAGSVEASHNLARDVAKELQGRRVAGTTLNTSIGYVGARVEGHYESQITVQLIQGELK